MFTSWSISNNGSSGSWKSFWIIMVFHIGFEWDEFLMEKKKINERTNGFWSWRTMKTDFNGGKSREEDDINEEQGNSHKWPTGTDFQTYLDAMGNMCQ